MAPLARAVLGDLLGGHLLSYPGGSRLGPSPARPGDQTTPDPTSPEGGPGDAGQRPRDNRPTVLRIPGDNAVGCANISVHTLRLEVPCGCWAGQGWGSVMTKNLRHHAMASILCLAGLPLLRGEAHNGI
jgi:hypothetical protein